jgi:hypothetical protein
MAGGMPERPFEAVFRAVIRDLEAHISSKSERVLPVLRYFVTRGLTSRTRLTGVNVPSYR